MCSSDLKKKKKPNSSLAACLPGRRTLTHAHTHPRTRTPGDAAAEPPELPHRGREVRSGQRCESDVAVGAVPCRAVPPTPPSPPRAAPCVRWWLRSESEKQNGMGGKGGGVRRRERRTALCLVVPCGFSSREPLVSPSAGSGDARLLFPHSCWELPGLDESRMAVNY